MCRKAVNQSINHDSHDMPPVLQSILLCANIGIGIGDIVFGRNAFDYGQKFKKVSLKTLPILTVPVLTFPVLTRNRSK